MILVIYSDSHISSIPGVGLVIYCTNVIPSRCVMSFPPVFCLCVVCCNSRFASPMLYGRALSTSRVFYAPIHLFFAFSTCRGEIFYLCDHAECRSSFTARLVYIGICHRRGLTPCVSAVYYLRAYLTWFLPSGNWIPPVQAAGGGDHAMTTRCARSREERGSFLHTWSPRLQRAIS